jgi:tetratricopeptide (TPR) repeat protein
MTIFAHEGFVLNLAFSPDSRTLATTSEDRSARLWEVPSGRPLGAFHGHTDVVWAVAFRPDGREVGTGSLDGSIRFWDLQTSRPVVVEHSGWVDRLAFRRDGLRVLSEPADWMGSKATKGWNPLTGELDPALSGTAFVKLPAEFVPGSIHLQNTATSPDGKLIAQQFDSTGGDAGPSRSKEYSQSAVVIREQATGQVVHTLIGHSADVVSFAFSPDGRRLATASYDRTMKLWDVETGQDVFTLLGHTAGLVCLAFSPDGNQIVTGSFDATARVWNATPLPSNVIAEHDARYRKKVETLTQLKGTNDEAQRAEILAGSGQWGMAAEAFAKAAAKKPDNLYLRTRLIAALVESGNRSRVEAACDDAFKQFWNAEATVQVVALAEFCRLAPLAIADPEKRKALDVLSMAMVGEPGVMSAYQEYCYKMLSRWGGVTDPVEAVRTIKACLLLPGSVHNPEQLAPLVKAAVSAGEAHEDYPWILFAEGLHHYRCGRFAEALGACRKSLERSATIPPLLVINHYVEAMSLHHLGEADDARKAMAEASRLLDEKAPGLDSIGGPWNAWLCCRILRREAEALIASAKEPRP